MYLMSGIPGSGKTTLAAQLSKQYHAALHSYDAVPGANTKGSTDGRVKQAWLEAIRNDLQAGKSVVCDGLNLTVEERKDVLAVVSDIPCQKVLIVKTIPLETCLQRNAQREARLPWFVLTQAARMFEPPSAEEGWDNIYVSTE